MAGDRRNPPDAPRYDSAEARWITEGPNSGGIAGWLLHQDHMFSFRHEGHSGEVGRGIPVEAWIADRGERHPGIVEDLRRREGSKGDDASSSG